MLDGARPKDDGLEAKARRPVPGSPSGAAGLVPDEAGAVVIPCRQAPKRAITELQQGGVGLIHSRPGPTILMSFAASQAQASHRRITQKKKISFSY
jgi:hypothetical protein